MHELEKIDVIRERLGVTYREAKEALAEAKGDVVEALIKLEEKAEETARNWDEKLQLKGHKWAAQVKEIVKKGNVTKVRVKKNGETVFEFPATVGALGLLGVLASSELAILAGLGTVGAMMKQYTLELERADGGKEEHPLQ